MTHLNSGLEPPLSISYGDSRKLKLLEIEQLRHKVWASLIGKQNIARFSIDRFDLQAWHFALRDNAKLVATARLNIQTKGSEIPDTQSFGSIINHICWPCCFFSRMVVDPDYQGLGLSSSIDNARIAFAEQLGGREAWIEIESWRCASLHKKGFSCVTRSDDISIPGQWLLLRKKFQTSAQSAQGRIS